MFSPPPFLRPGYYYKDMLCSHDGHIKAVFIPPNVNTTSVIQPLDGDNLETAKHNYHKLLLQHVMAENDERAHLLCWRPLSKSDIVHDGKEPGKMYAQSLFPRFGARPC